MTTPLLRIALAISEGAKFIAELPGSFRVDMTADIIAALAQTGTDPATDTRLTRSREHGENAKPREASGNRAASCR